MDSEAGLFTPAIKGASDGLELQWWVVRGDLHNLADFSALQPSGAGVQPAFSLVQSPDSSLASPPLWPSHGLRLFTIRLEDLPEFERRLGIAEGASTSGLGVQRQWLGQSPTWSPFVEGPELGPIGLWMESGPLALPAGRLRLLGRAWTEPVALASDTCRPVLRIELAPQHAEPPRPDPLGLAPPATTECIDEGLLFRRLALTLRVPEGHAVVIIPERPDVIWGEPDPIPADNTSREESEDRLAAPFAHIVRGDPDANPDTRTADTGSGRDTDIAANTAIELDDTGPGSGTSDPFRRDDAPIRHAGPRAPRLSTLGEAMLMSIRATHPDAPRRTTRAIVVLIPQLPDDYRLLPR